MARDWRMWLLVLYVLAFGAILADAGSLSEPSWYPFAIGLLLLSSAPIAQLCLWRGQALVKGLGALVIGGLGLWLIIDVMYLSPPDGQAALVFLIVPVLQVAAGAVFALAVFIGVKLLGKEE